MRRNRSSRGLRVPVRNDPVSPPSAGNRSSVLPVPWLVSCGISPFPFPGCETDLALVTPSVFFFFSYLGVPLTSVAGRFRDSPFNSHRFLQVHSNSFLYGFFFLFFVVLCARSLIPCPVFNVFFPPFFVPRSLRPFPCIFFFFFLSISPLSSPLYVPLHLFFSFLRAVGHKNGTPLAFFPSQGYVSPCRQAVFLLCELSSYQARAPLGCFSFSFFGAYSPPASVRSSFDL